MTLYLLKIQRSWGLRKQRGGATSNSPQHPSEAREGLQLFTSAEVFQSSYPSSSPASISSRPIPNPFLFYLHQRYLSWLNLDGSSLVGLHPKWKFFTAQALWSQPWASASGQRTSTNPLGTFQYNGHRAASPITTRGSLKQTHPFIQSH